MDELLKQVIDHQILESKNLRKPNKNDISDYKCLIEINNKKINIYVPNVFVEERLKTFINILNYVDINKNISFLLDTSDCSSKEDPECLMLCNTKHKEQKYITIPNHHILIGGLLNYINYIQNNDIDFSKKINKTCFAGSPCGFSPNIQIKESKKKYKNIDFENCNTGKRLKYLINIFYNFQNNHDCFLSSNQAIPINKQLLYKYLINIDGETLCWDRIYWQMYSNSLPIYVERDENKTELYHELLKPRIHYFPSKIDDIEENFKYLNTEVGLQESNSIIKNGKDFILKYFIKEQNNYIDVIKYILLNL